MESGAEQKKKGESKVITSIPISGPTHHTAIGAGGGGGGTVWHNGWEAVLQPKLIRLSHFHSAHRLS